MNEMTDAEFTTAFLQGTLSPTHFHHRDHLRLAWLLIRERGAEVAGPLIADGIRAFAARHGHLQKYHQTLTQFWIWAVGRHAAARPDISDFSTFLATFPLLLEANLPERHWNHATLFGADARARWVAPDLLALPA
jgi:hypothetical protein